MDFSKQKNQNKQLTKGNYNEKLYSRLWLYVLRILCVAILLATFAVAGIGLGTFLGMLDGVPEVSLNSLAIDQQTTTVVDQNGTLVTELKTAEQRTAIPYEEMPEDLIHAIVAIEDSRFFQHNGIDLEGILRAGITNLRSGGTSEGGSTLTQQMIKQMVLTDDQTWKRKIQEWYLALQLEYKMGQEYGKERTKELILESYLNYNFLGNNCYGVEAAAQRYFGKSASEMNLAECALIAGIFNAPSAYDPISNTNNISRERQLQVLDAMLKQEYITQEEYDAAVADDVFSRVTAWNEQYESTEEDVLYSYFVDSVITQAQADIQEQLGCSEQEAYNTLFYGGYTIHITQDSNIQAIVDAAFADTSNFQYYTYYELDYRLTVYDEKDPTITDNFSTVGLFYSPEQAQMAADEFKSQYVTSDMQEGTDYVESTTITEEPQYSMTVIDQHTGYVVALAGGRGEKKTNMGINRAIDAPRQPGSTFKILASYAAALDTGGFSPGSSMDDAPMNWGDWSPQNWWGSSYYRGFCTMREGIRDSLNIVTARFMREVGIETNFDYVENFGISTLRREPDSSGETDMVGSLCLGSGSVTNLELCAAYATIANAGQYIEPRLYTHITDRNGNTFIDNTPETRQVIKPTTAYMLCDMMRDVVTSGTGTACNFDSSMAIAGKTGTTSNYNDYSFVGFTPYYTCTVMAGFDYVSYPEVYYQSLGSYSLDPAGTDANGGASFLEDGAHKTLWSTVMAGIHQSLPSSDTFFEQPEGLTMTSICIDSGKAPGPYCANDARGNRVTYDWCEVGNEPTEVCDRHVQVTVCSESGKLATEFCPSTKTSVFITRTEEEIAEIGAENLGKIQDYPYANYGTSMSDRCDIHTKPQESSVTNNSNNSSSSNSSTAGSSSGSPAESQPPTESSAPPAAESSPNAENTGGQ